MSSFVNELQCPITLDWLEDPVCVPCCGRAFSRAALVSHMSTSYVCPMCRGDLSTIDPLAAPRNTVISNMVEIARTGTVGTSISTSTVLAPAPAPAWVSKNVLILNEGDNTEGAVISQLQLVCNDRSVQLQSNNKTLLILVVDKSGSMSGSPIDQVRYALTRIMQAVNNSTNVKLVIIAYDDTFREISNPATLGASGGTSFSAAFNGICNTCQNNSAVKNAVVIFLTDGEDSRVPKDRRSELVSDLRRQLRTHWPQETKKMVVHAIGFGASHDFAFLDAIRKVGTEEGAYRYADPSENTDSLSAKINSIADTIVSSSRVPVEITIDGETIKTDLIDGQINLWRKPVEPASSHCILKCGDSDPISLDLEIVHSCDRNLWVKWYSKLTDDLIAETIEFNNTKDTLDADDLELFGTLLTLRARAILKRLEQVPRDESELEIDPEPVIGRLNATLVNVAEIMAGRQVDKLKLTDLKYESQFKTTITQTQKSLPAAPRTLTSTAAPSTNATVVPTWDLYRYRTGSRYNEGSEIHRRIMTAKPTNVMELYLTDCNKLDGNGNTPLALAVSIGRIGVVEQMLALDKSSINTPNSFGETPLDLAALYGYWKSYDVLAAAGAVHGTSVTGQTIFNTCLSQGFTSTADRLLAAGIGKVRQEMATYRGVTTHTAMWLLANMETDFLSKIDTSIRKGIVSNIVSNMSKIEVGSLKFADYADIIASPTVEQCRIFDLLMENGKLNPLEEWTAMRTTYSYSYIQGGELDESEEIQWPLFIAAEKGQQSMVNVLLKHMKHVGINKQNRKGTTALWIACCNLHADTVLTLLSNSADPNICNHKGDSPLIPACQKGNTTIVRLLLESGIDIRLHNRSRDNAVLICCRNGQADVLDLLLKEYAKLGPEALSAVLTEFAEIDGFNPLLAATELNRDKCIEVLHRHGADLEHRTTMTNEILKGATAAHIAAYYGRTNALKMLHKLGADMESKTLDTGMTPLHISVQRGHGYDGNVANVRFLFSIGVNTDVTDNLGRKPIYYASNKGNEVIFKEFFDNPLIGPLVKLIRSTRDKTSACKIIREHGESAGVYDHTTIVTTDCGQGVTPLELATMVGDSELCTTFEGMGANPEAKNYHGISASFWKNLMSGNSADPMVAKVQHAVGSSIQNKLLMNISTRPSSYSTDLDRRNGDMRTKMNIGYGQKVRKTVLEQLQLAPYGEHSLVSFLDKSNKLVVSCSKEELSQLIWDAKIHMVSTIATEADDSLLKPAHHLALYIYTADDNICKQINDVLASWTTDNLWTPYINCLYQGLTLIPKFQNECYRKVYGKFQNLPVGSVVEWNTFAIATSDWSNVVETESQAAVIYIIKSKTGRYLSLYSKYPQNNEVVFLPGSKFVVKDYYLNNVIVFGQANIRKVTYGARDVDLAKAVEGKTSIIVDIEEINELSLTDGSA